MEILQVGYYCAILLQLSVAMFLAFWIHRLSNKLLPFSVFRIVVGLGIVLHELSHALGCLLTGAKIESIQFFNREGGKVVHQPSKIPVFGPVFISMAPAVVSLLVWYFVSIYYAYEAEPHMLASKYSHKVGSATSNLFSIPSFSSLNFWIYILLTFNLAIAMVPSKQDFRNCSFFLCLVIALFFAIDYYSWLQFAWLIKLHYSCMYLVIYLLALFFLELIIYGIYEIVKK